MPVWVWIWGTAISTLVGLAIVNWLMARAEYLFAKRDMTRATMCHVEMDLRERREKTQKDRKDGL